MKGVSWIFWFTFSGDQVSEFVCQRLSKFRCQRVSFCLSKMFHCLQVLCILFVRGFYGLCVGGFLHVMSIFFVRRFCGWRVSSCTVCLSEFWYQMVSLGPIFCFYEFIQFLSEGFFRFRSYVCQGFGCLKVASGLLFCCVCDVRV